MNVSVADVESHFPAITQHLHRNELEALAGALRPLELTRGTPLIREGESTDSLFLIEEGRLTVTIDVAGTPRAVGHLERGSIAGEVSLMDPGPASATVTADSPALILALSHSSLDKLAAAQPHVATAILRVLCNALADRTRQADARYDEILCEIDPQASLPPTAEHHRLMDWFRILFSSRK